MRRYLLFYQPGDSLFHRLTPLAKLIWAVAMTAVAVVADSAAGQAVVLAIAVFCVRILSQVRLGSLSSIVRIFLGLAATFFVIQALTIPGEQVIGRLGGITLTAEALDHAGSVALRMAVLIFVAVAFVTTTDPVDLGVSLHEQLRLPRTFALMFFLTLRVAEVFERELEGLNNTRRLRYAGRSDGIFGSLRRAGWLVLALFTRGIRRSQTIALSMTIRGADRVVAAASAPPLSRLDLVFMLATLGLAAVTAVAVG